MEIQLVSIEFSQKSWFTGSSIKRNGEKRKRRQGLRNRKSQRFYENLASIRVILGQIGDGTIGRPIFLKHCMPCQIPDSLSLGIALFSNIIVLHFWFCCRVKRLYLPNLCLYLSIIYNNFCDFHEGKTLHLQYEKKNSTEAGQEGNRKGKSKRIN